MSPLAPQPRAHVRRAGGFWRQPLWAPLNDAEAWNRLVRIVNPAWSVTEPRARVVRVVDEAPGVRFIFPHAPYRPVTCNGGYVMRAWYDIISLEPDSRKIDEAGLLESREIVRQLIQREEKRGIPSQRIFLAGFSQGGAVAYLSALTHPEPLAGVIALSTYIPEARLITEDLSAANRHIPLFVAHGTDDDVVSIKLGRQAIALLGQCGLKPAWHTYDMPHSVCIDEVRDIGTWLNARISVLEAAP